MKNNTYKISLMGLLMAVASIALVSCKKDKTDPEETAPVVTPTGTLMLHLHTYLDENEVDLYNIVYTTSAGRDISLSMAQLYLSGIELVKADGSIYSVSGKNVLKLFEAESFMVGEVPVGNYKAVRFKVGLDPATNQSAPSTSSDASILDRPEMWFGASAQPDGYVFLNFQGMIDTTASMTGPLVPFEYKIGTNANYKQVILPDNNFSVIKDQVGYVHLMADYNKLFDGIQLNQNDNLFVESAADNSTPVAQAIVDNIPAMFSYEE